jgi:hypothetical protein
MDQLDLNKTPLAWFQDMYKEAKHQEIRKHLGLMGITGNLAVQVFAEKFDFISSILLFFFIAYLFSFWRTEKSSGFCSCDMETTQLALT